MLDDKLVARGDEYQDSIESSLRHASGLGLTRDTRATVEQVLDPRTLAILKKLEKRGVYQTMEGCISTGKEANVYYAHDAAGKDLAIKIYKTSILSFRDRDEYVDGEFRFRRGYCKSNPRKMVAVWAEKEQRNLRRIFQAGIPCPEVVFGSQNVLVMTLIGDEKVAARRLKEIASEPSRGWVNVYLDAVRIMRRMYQECRLVHGDLSEYNMLVDERENLFVIDVSQSVEHAHPRALDFLKRDCFNVNAFFSKREVPVIRLPSLFDFITAAAVPLQQPAPQVDFVDAATVMFNSLEEEAWLQNTFQLNPADEGDDDVVFIQTWIPTSLAQVGDFVEIERDIARRNEGKNTMFDRLVATPDTATDELTESDSASSDSSSDSGEESSSVGSAASGDEAKDVHDGHRPEGMSKAEWKKIVKEERREARKHKVPKHLKKKRNVKKFGCRR